MAPGKQKTVNQITALEPFHWTVLLHCSIIGLVLLLDVLPLFTIGISSRRIYTDLPPWTCLPNGRITYPWGTENYSGQVWKTDSILSINLGFGHFSFGAAKWIDVLWEVIMGHGGQAVLGYLTYKVFMKAMLFSMQSNPASFELYAILSFKTFSAETLWTVLKQVVTGHQTRAGKSQKPTRPSSYTFVALILAGAYVLAFPVMLSAMTGYQAISRSYVARPDTGDLIEMMVLRETQIILIDGARIGLQDDSRIPVGSEYEAQLENYILQNDDIAGTAANHTANDLPGFNRNGSSQITIRNGGVFNLPPPLLTFMNIDDFPSNYTAENVTFNSTWISASGTCEPSDEYRCGFSFLFLFVFCVLTAAVVALLCTVWWTVYWHSRFDRTEHGFNVYSAVMDMASNVATDLGDEGADLTAEALKQEIRRRRCTVKLKAEGLPVSRQQEEAMIRQGNVDAKLLPGNRGIVGFFFTQQDVHRAKTALPRWRERAALTVTRRQNDLVELRPVASGPYVRIPDKPGMQVNASSHEAGEVIERRESAEGSASLSAVGTFESEEEAALTPRVGSINSDGGVDEHLVADDRSVDFGVKGASQREG